MTERHLRRSLFFCTWCLDIIIRIFTIIHNVLQHYWHERCRHESWSSLLMSLLAENNRGEGAFQVLWQSIRKDCFKRRDNLQMFHLTFGDCLSFFRRIVKILEMSLTSIKTNVYMKKSFYSKCVCMCVCVYVCVCVCVCALLSHFSQLSLLPHFYLTYTTCWPQSLASPVKPPGVSGWDWHGPFSSLVPSSIPLSQLLSQQIDNNWTICGRNLK